MIELKKEIVRNGGRKYHQLFKNDKFAAYECTQTLEDGSTTIWCEIFKIRVRKPDKFTNDIHEVYPSDRDFGDWAWCCSYYGQVERVFKNDLDEDISEYAKFFTRLRLQGDEMLKPCNYEGTYKISPYVRDGWMMFN